jgi:hypothetical protein
MSAYLRVSVHVVCLLSALERETGDQLPKAHRQKVSYSQTSECEIFILKNVGCSFAIVLQSISQKNVVKGFFKTHRFNSAE